MHIVEQKQEGIIIDAYAQNSVSINGQSHSQSLVILPQIGVKSWPIANLASLCLDHCQCFEAPGLEVILIGHQATSNASLQDDIRLHFASQAIGIEVMDIGAACRTYNVLASEGRMIAAGFILE